MGDMPQTLQIRKALPEDADDILRWRNDPEVCAMSLNTEPVAASAHHDWYARVLADPDRLLLIGISSALKVGFVRFDKRDLSLWEVSIVIAPDMRGKKMGLKLLTLGLEYVAGQYGTQDFRAIVHHSNEASLALFEALKFHRIGEDGAFVTLMLPSNVD